jgi:sec-independent protein translocase protein TatB
VFDVGFFELLVVGGVALVVIGPEKLPGAIKTGALWIGRLKRSLLETRREIEQQIGADEIRRELRNEEIMASLEKLRQVREELERDIESASRGQLLEHSADTSTSGASTSDLSTSDVSTSDTSGTTRLANDASANTPDAHKLPHNHSKPSLSDTAVQSADPLKSSSTPKPHDRHI